MIPMTYTCTKCDTPAEVVDGVVMKHCECECGIAAHLSAVATGEGTMN